MARGNGRDKVAGRNLGIAIQFFRVEKQISALQKYPRWQNAKLPSEEKTLRDWVKNGIPKESLKVELVAQCLRIPLNLFKSKDDEQIQAILAKNNGVEETQTEKALEDPPIGVISPGGNSSLSKTAREWAKAFDYVFMETTVDAFYREISKGPTMGTYHERESAFLLLCATYKGNKWDLWTKTNVNNRVAIRGLLETFRTNHWRVRFRALYALGKMNRHQVRKVLSELSGLSLETVFAVQDATDGNALSFIKKAAVCGDENIERKAKQVLSEIAEVWKDMRTGRKSLL